MAKPSTGKRALPRNGLVEKKCRLTIGQMAKLERYLALNDGRGESQGIRDVLNAGFRSLGIIDDVAGSIAPAPLRKAA